MNKKGIGRNAPFHLSWLEGRFSVCVWLTAPGRLSPGQETKRHSKINKLALQLTSQEQTVALFTQRSCNSVIQKTQHYAGSAFLQLTKQCHHQISAICYFLFFIIKSIVTVSSENNSLVFTANMKQILSHGLIIYKVNVKRMCDLKICSTWAKNLLMSQGFTECFVGRTKWRRGAVPLFSYWDLGSSGGQSWGQSWSFWRNKQLDSALVQSRLPAGGELSLLF